MKGNSCSQCAQAWPSCIRRSATLTCLPFAISFRRRAVSCFHPLRSCPNRTRYAERFCRSFSESFDARCFRSRNAVAVMDGKLAASAIRSRGAFAERCLYHGQWLKCSPPQGKADEGVRPTPGFFAWLRMTTGAKGSGQAGDEFGVRPAGAAGRRWRTTPPSARWGLHQRQGPSGAWTPPSRISSSA